MKKWSVGKPLRFIRKHSFLFAVAVLLSLSAVSGLLIAKYVQTSNTMTDIYMPASYNAVTVLSEQSEDTDSRLYLTNVRVQTGNQGYPVYVRAALIVTWQNEQGQLYGQQPIEGVDYSFSYDEEHWKLYAGDGYYYYDRSLPGGGTTEPFIGPAQQLKQLKDPPKSGFRLRVEVAAETIQAVGTTRPGEIAAVIDAWNHHP